MPLITFTSALEWPKAIGSNGNNGRRRILLNYPVQPGRLGVRIPPGAHRG